MRVLSETTTFYVRCIKPNDAKAALGFGFTQVRNQCAYLGVLEVVRIRQQGFPVRLPYAQFLERLVASLSKSCKFCNGLSLSPAAPARADFLSPGQSRSQGRDLSPKSHSRSRG